MKNLSVALIVIALGCRAPTDAAEPAAPAAVTPVPAAIAAGPDPAFLLQFARTWGYRLGAPRSPALTPTGDAVVFLRSGAWSMRSDLYQLDTATGAERVLLSAADLAAADGALPAAEASRRERQRLTARGIARFELSRDGTRILAPLGSKLFAIERATGAAREVSIGGGYAIDPRLSPDGTAIALVKAGDVYVVDIGSGEVLRITERDSDRIEHGLAEFVAQEEMMRSRGYWWSPDSRSIVYQRTDVSPIDLLHIADPSRPDRAPTTQRYPRAGTANADVQLAIASADGSGTPTWIDWDRAAFPYVVDVDWSESAPLTIVVQNRAQTELRLLAVEPTTGATTQLVRETDPTWIDIDPAMPTWLPGGAMFLWTSERSGYRQLELRRRDGSLEVVLTPAEFGYRGLGHVDAERRVAYVHGNAPGDPTQQHVFRVSLAGGAEPAQLSAGRGIHRVRFSRDGSTYLHVTKPWRGTSTAAVHRVDGTELARLTSNTPEPPWDANVELASVELDGRTHWASIVRPRAFDRTKRYPVVLSVYGGPWIQRVTARGMSYLLSQWQADHGFIVVAIDGRGTPYRGRDWGRVFHGDFAAIPLADQANGLAALGERYPELDLGRVGIVGHSFGGYMAAMAVLRRPDVFHAGIASAPVVDWRDYDTHYTERYIGDPRTNAAAYDRSSLLTYASKLERPLIIAHGTADDNVHYAHAAKLSDALLRAGKLHTLVPLLGQTHRVADPVLRAQLIAVRLEFFREHLGAPELR